MNDMNPIENMLADVRRAHRLVFEYQKRMLDLMQLVRNLYDFPNSPAGKKHFSAPLHNTEKFSKDNKDANINIDGKWAWDFIYSYYCQFTGWHSMLPHFPSRHVDNFSHFTNSLYKIKTE